MIDLRRQQKTGVGCHRGTNLLRPATFAPGGRTTQYRWPTYSTYLPNMANISPSENVCHKLDKQEDPRLDPANCPPKNRIETIHRIMGSQNTTQLTRYFADDHLVHINKNNFFQKESNCTCMTGCYNIWMLAMAVCLNVVKAFNKIPTLGREAWSDPNGPPILSSYMLYVSSRNQVTRVNVWTFHPSSVPRDVLLFLLHVIRNGIPFLFADDIKIAYIFRSEALG